MAMQDNNMIHQSADGRIATEAAWLNGNRFMERRKQECALTSTGFLMEGVAHYFLRRITFDSVHSRVAHRGAGNSYSATRFPRSLSSDHLNRTGSQKASNGTATAQAN